MKATNTLRRFAFGAMTALALLAGSAQVQAQTVNPTGQSFVASIADYSGPTANADYARDYVKAAQELADGKLVGVAFSTGTWGANKPGVQIMTPMQRRVALDGTGSAGRNAGGTAASPTF